MPFTVINTPLTGPNVTACNSTSQVYAAATGALVQTSDQFTLPGAALTRPGSGWRLSFNGVINQGTTVEPVVYGSGGSPLGANLLPAVTVPASLMAASTAYPVLIEWEWACLSVTGDTAVGYARATGTLFPANTATMAAPIGCCQVVGNWNLQFNQPLGGNNVQPANFYVTVSMANGGGETYMNFARFEWYPGPS